MPFLYSLLFAALALIAFIALSVTWRVESSFVNDTEYSDVCRFLSRKSLIRFSALSWLSQLQSVIMAAMQAMAVFIDRYMLREESKGLETWKRAL